MAKKRWLLNILKKLFLCDTQSQPENKQTKKLKQLPELEDAREEHMKHAINVARATAAAAEAAVAAAQAAAAVVRLTGIPKTPRLMDKELQNWAAVKIQTSFRGYLARKALKALKGVVRLQAIARGRAVRRRVSNVLERSSPFVERLREFDLDTGMENGNRFRPYIRTKMELGEAIRVDYKAERQWNDRTYTKEDLKPLSLRRQEAVGRRDRMKQYSYSHRERRLQFAHILEEPMTSRRYNDRYWVRHWAGEKLNLHSNPRTGSNIEGTLRLSQRSIRREDSIEEESYTPISNPRRSLCQMRERSSGEESVPMCSPVFPSYMATTESTKARMRSMSTPRQRIKYLDHYHSNCYDYGGARGGGDLHKNMRSTWAAFNCEAMSSVSKVNNAHQLRSLSMRSLKPP